MEGLQFLGTLGLNTDNISVISGIDQRSLSTTEGGESCEEVNIEISDQASTFLDQGEHDITVPPPTPSSSYSFAEFYEPPGRFRVFREEDKLPYIKEVGVKGCIEELSKFFGCPNYKFDPVQFWFLDVVADGLWMAQDEFQFPEEYQKVIVEWITYAFELIREPSRNLTRKQFFEIFDEATKIANDKIQGGCAMLPSPEDVFVFVEEELEEPVDLSSESSNEDDSTISIDPQSAPSFMAIQAGNKLELYKLPNQYPLCYKTLYSSQNSSEEEEEEEEVDSKDLEDAEFSHVSSFNSFYKPDPGTPDRFKSLSSSSSSSWSQTTPLEPMKATSQVSQLEPLSKNPEESEEDELVEDLTAIKEFTWTPNSTNSAFSRALCPENVYMSDEDEVIHPEQSKSQKIQSQSTVRIMSSSISKSYYDTSEPHVNKGVSDGKNFGNWTPPKATPNSEGTWWKYIQDQANVIKEIDRQIFVNSCALSAVKQFIYDYFSETFQFIIIKTALMNSSSMMTHRINSTWNVPKIIKTELKKPKPKKEKKPKKVKEKKKKSSKKSSSKKSKKSKSSKSSKKSKKDKKSKKHKPTKEEKAEMARLKKEQLRLEEELRKAEENRRLLFPLNDAANEDFFKQIFENWVRPKEGKGGKKGKKGKRKK